MQKKYQNIIVVISAVIFTVIIASNISEIRDAGIGFGSAIQEAFSKNSK